jgi:hypothetical protein
MKALLFLFIIVMVSFITYSLKKNRSTALKYQIGETVWIKPDSIKVIILDSYSARPEPVYIVDWYGDDKPITQSLIY